MNLFLILAVLAIVRSLEEKTADKSCEVMGKMYLVGCRGPEEVLKVTR